MRNLNERGICASAFMNVYCADVYKICAQAMFATLWQIRRFYNSLTSVPGLGCVETAADGSGIAGAGRNRACRSVLPLFLGICCLCGGIFRISAA